MRRELFGAADLFRRRLTKAFNFVLQEKLQLAKQELERDTYERLLAEKGASFDANEQEEADAEAALLKSKDLGEQGVVDAADIFALLDADGDGELKMDEFMRLFDVLNFPLSDNQKERLFAYSDLSGSGTITDEEFKEGWEEMVRVFLEQSSHEFGLTDMQIYGVVFAVLAILLLLFVFLFLALSGWYSERGFEAVVQTTLVAGLGKTSAYLRQRSKVENADDLEQIVADIMDNQEDSASGD